MKKTLALTITLLLGASGIAMADHPEPSQTDEPSLICTPTLSFVATLLRASCGPRLLGPPQEQPSDEARLLGPPLPQPKAGSDRRGDRDPHHTKPPVSSPNDG